MAEAALKTEETAKPAPRKFLAPGRFVEPSHARRIHLVTVENGTTLEDIQQPWFFKQTEARPISIGDRMEVRDDQLSFVADLIVVSATATHSNVVTRVVSYTQLDPMNVEVGHSEDFEVKWTGVTGKWKVFRTKDQHVMPGTFASRGDGEQHVRSTLRQRKI